MRHSPYVRALPGASSVLIPSNGCALLGSSPFSGGEMGSDERAENLSGDVPRRATQRSDQQSGRVVYGYIRVAVGDEIAVGILKADLLLFCRSNNFMLSTVFTDIDVDDSAVVRPGFTALLDVCKLVGSYGVVVPSYRHLSSFVSTLEFLKLQIKRTGAHLIVVDDAQTMRPVLPASAQGVESKQAERATGDSSDAWSDPAEGADAS
jgi:hypothetical protein